MFYLISNFWGCIKTVFFFIEIDTFYWNCIFLYQVVLKFSSCGEIHMKFRQCLLFFSWFCASPTYICISSLSTLLPSSLDLQVALILAFIHILSLFYRIIYQIQILVHNGGLAYIQVKKKKKKTMIALKSFTKPYFYTWKNISFEC